MNLTKWYSNSKQVGNKIFKEFDPRLGVDGPTRVLGLKWILSDDGFSFNGIQLPDNLVTTKRVVLSFIARLFYPPGFIKYHLVSQQNYCFIEHHLLSQQNYCFKSFGSYGLNKMQHYQTSCFNCLRNG